MANPQMGYPFQQNNNYMQPQPYVTFALVEGDLAVNNFLVAINTKAILIDFVGMKLTIKERDSSGILLPLRVFKLDEIVNTIPQPNNSQNFNQNEFVTVEQFEELKQMIANLSSSNNVREQVNNKPNNKQRGNER